MAERAFVNLCRLSLEHSEGKVIPFLCIAKGPKGIKAVAQLLKTEIHNTLLLMNPHYILNRASCFEADEK
uniref:Uncharacterized protein n=2 Tax=Picea TaxID=3328 RepID=A0A124GP42_PICGL|nr:hypothetical protein ABT39_MTgene622 [Picea glauca]QHR92779.1 hypothetical protein Q903MT_gene6827 [Picea sitchensis]